MISTKTGPIAKYVQGPQLFEFGKELMQGIFVARYLFEHFLISKWLGGEYQGLIPSSSCNVTRTWRVSKQAWSFSIGLQLWQRLRSTILIVTSKATIGYEWKYGPTISICPPLKYLIFRLLSVHLPPILFHHLHIIFDCYDVLFNHSEVVVISGHHVYLWYSYSSCSSWNYLHLIS